MLREQKRERQIFLYRFPREQSKLLPDEARIRVLEHAAFCITPRQLTAERRQETCQRRQQCTFAAAGFADNGKREPAGTENVRCLSNVLPLWPMARSLTLSSAAQVRASGAMVIFYSLQMVPVMSGAWLRMPTLTSQSAAS